MNQFLFILLIISIIVVVASLIAGIVGMGRGGDFNAKYGNKLMRIRVMAQGAALLLLALLMLSK